MSPALRNVEDPSLRIRNTAAVLTSQLMLQAPITQEVTEAQEANLPPTFPAPADPSDLLHSQLALRTSSTAQRGLVEKEGWSWSKAEKDGEGRGVK